MNRPNWLVALAILSRRLLVFVGENVKGLFRRLAAVTFEQAILRELESQGARLGTPQIGAGGVLSKYLYKTWIVLLVTRVIFVLR